MTTPTSNLDPALFTTFRTWRDDGYCESNVIAPEECVCPYCSTLLKLYKTISSRSVRTLQGTIHFREIWKYCPNPDCLGRDWDPQTREYRSKLFKSSKVRQLVLPNKHYGLDVVLEIGRKTYEEGKTGEQVQRELTRDYPLTISLASVYRYRDIFEALSIGITHDHHEEIAKKLQEQPAFIVVFDAMQFGSGHKLYRAIDFLSGFQLGALVVYEGGKDQLKQWRQELFTMFGIPDYIVSDGEAALHLDPEKEPEIPHQDCWYHVEQNVWDALFKDWRNRAKKFLQQTSYRTKLSKIFQTLGPTDQEDSSATVKHVRTLLEVFMNQPPRGSGFEGPLAVRHHQFREAFSVVNQWVRALQGQKGKYNVEEQQLQEYQALKALLPSHERVNYLQHEAFTGESCVQALVDIQDLLNKICGSKTFNNLLTCYKTKYDEFERLRSWVLEAIVRRNEQDDWKSKDPKTESEARLFQLLNQATDRAKKELAKIPLKCRAWQAWQWRDGEPEVPLTKKAQETLVGIINRWNHKDSSDKDLKKAVAILQRQFDNLLTFFDHVAIPVSNQAIETDNGVLKQFWRRLTGGQDRPYTLPYHGLGASMTMNYVKNRKNMSPLELLGFNAETIDYWYRTCTPEQLAIQSQYMEEVRRPRKLIIQAKRQSLQEVFKETYKDWVNYGIKQLSQYVDRKGS